MELEARVVGPAPLVGAMCEAIGLVEVIDQLVEWDPAQCRLSPGTRVKALVVNILTGRRPLYRVGEAFEDGDVELVLGRGVSIQDLNDNALARALDKLFEAGPRRVLAAVAARAVLVEKVDRHRLHWDSTSRSVYGVYEGDSGPLNVTHGYSKDHRPDLRQFLIDLLCTREGIPVTGEVQDGNHSDKVGNAKAIDALVAALEPEELQKLIYVADSALCTGPNLAKMRQAKLRFVTRLPETFAAAAQVRKQAWASDRWEDLGRLSPEPGAASYRASEQTVEIDGHQYRAVVIQSDHLDQRKQKTLERLMATERERVQKGAAELRAQIFYCQDDAETAAGRGLMEEEHGLIPVKAEAKPEEQTLPRPRPGRPRAGEAAPTRQVYRVHCEICEPSPERLEQWRRRENYVHRRDRLEALIYVLVMACLVFSLLERRVRQALAERGEQLVVPGHRAVDKPTANSLLEMLAKVIVVRAGPDHRVLASSPSSRQRTARILELAGFELSIYTTPPEAKTA